VQVSYTGGVPGCTARNPISTACKTRSDELFGIEGLVAAYAKRLRGVYLSDKAGDAPNNGAFDSPSTPPQELDVQVSAAMQGALHALPLRVLSLEQRGKHDRAGDIFSDVDFSSLFSAVR
jgi:hypothetical protein